MSSTANLVYITVGTGIGIGVVTNGKVVHGLVHPEGGHICIKKAEADKDFKGVCPFHGDCLEGLCSNIAIATRKGLKIEDLSGLNDDDPVWISVANYLAQAILNLTLILSPERVVIGGGIMNRKMLLPMIQKEFVKLLNKYVQHPLLEEPEKYIVYPNYYPDNGIMAAILLGIEK